MHHYDTKLGFATNNIQINLQTIVMWRGKFNQENTRVAANFVNYF